MRPKAHINHDESLRWAKPTWKHKKEANHLPGALELAPTLSLLAVEGWACSNCLFNLNKGKNNAGRLAPINDEPTKAAS
jgi:hypothetical protein